jgi:hypothetical protein
MFEEEFIKKHIEYVFKNWNVNFEDLDQDVNAEYNDDALPKSVEDLIYDYYIEDIRKILENISNDNNLFFLYNDVVLDKLSKIDSTILNQREKLVLYFLKENYDSKSNKCCWDLILDNFYNVLETLRKKYIENNLKTKN